MTLSQVEDQFDYWRRNPPIHELVASFMGFKPPLTIEEQWAQGAMGPADFLAWVEATEGKKVAPGG